MLENLAPKTFVRSEPAAKNYKNADIRGMNFSRSDLTGCDFSGSLAGQRLFWRLTVRAILFALIFTSSLVVGFGSGALGSLLIGMNGLITGDHQIATLLLFGVVSFGSILFFGCVITKIGSDSNLVTWSLIVSIALVALLLLLANPDFPWQVGLLILFMCITAIFSGSILAGISVATWGVVFDEEHYPLLVVFYLIATAIGIYFSIYYGEQKPLIATELLLPGFSICGTIAGVALWLAYFMGKKASLSSYESYSILHKVSRIIASLGGTKFYKADLTDVNFSNAVLKNTDFRGATLVQTNWHQVKGLSHAIVESTYLENAVIQQLVVSKQANKMNFDDCNLSGLNLVDANLAESSFMNANFSNSLLKNANLSKTKLAKAQLYATNLEGAFLDGVYIQDWAISTDTNFRGVSCSHVYMRIPTDDNTDTWRKPDRRDEFFEDGDFLDFIAPIIKTLDLYTQPGVDLRQVASSLKTLDLYHHQGIDPSAASIALKQIANEHPDARIEVVSLEGRGKEKIKLQAIVSGEMSQSELSNEYFERYSTVSALPHKDIEDLLESISEKDKQIRSLEDMVKTVMQGQKFYIETQYEMNNIDMKHTSKPEVKTILVLSANPIDTKPLRLNEEVRELQKSLDRSKSRDSYKLEQRWAVTPVDLRRALLDTRPYLVHFSGHGVGGKANNTRSSDINSESKSLDGLVFEDDHGRKRMVSGEVLADLFALFSNDIECVVLNSCYSEKQADAIVRHIPYVIGMTREIGDQAAIKFSMGFYDALLADNPVEFAFKAGCNGISLAGISEHLTPTIKTKANL